MSMANFSPEQSTTSPYLEIPRAWCRGVRLWAIAYTQGGKDIVVESYLFPQISGMCRGGTSAMQVPASLNTPHD